MIFLKQKQTFVIFGSAQLTITELEFSQKDYSIFPNENTVVEPK
jgi:hypothetical protein